MSKGLAYFCLAVVTVAILGVDYLVLTSSATVTRIVKAEIDRYPEIEYGSIRATWDGSITLSGIGLHLTQKRIRVLSAERVDVKLVRRAGTFVPESVRLVDPRVTLNQDFLDQIQKEPAGRPLRETYPADALPRISCRGGQLELVHRQFLHWSAPQTFAIEELSLVPVSGYRYFAGGRLRSALLGEWQVSGDFDLDTGAVHVALTSGTVQLGPRLRAVLSPSIHNDWDRYSPDGPVRVRILVDAEPGKPAQFHATVNPEGMKLCYRNFPYPVEDVRGELDFFADRFVIKHMSGRNGHTGLRFDGAAGGYDAAADFKFRIEIDGMPLDDRLRAAIPAAAKRIWDDFRPAGLIDVKGVVEREYGRDKKERIPLDIRFRGATFRYLPFPYELEDVNGEIHVDTPLVLVKRLDGRHGAGTFRIAGRIDDIDQDPVIDIQIHGENVKFDDALKHALGEEERKLWDRFKPAGSVDLDWRVAKKKGEKERHYGEADARGCRVTYKDVPLPVSDVAGHVSYGPEAVLLSHLEGKLDEGKVAVNGRATTDGKTWTHVYDIGAVGARVDDRFKKAMPTTIADLLETLRLTGLVNFQMNLEMKGDGASEEMVWTIRIDLRRAAIDAAIRFEDIEGQVSFVGSLKNGKTTGTGYLRFDSMRVMKKKATNVTASFTLKEDGVVSFTRIHGDAYGGTVTGDISINTDTTDLAGAFRLDRLELREFVRDTDSYSTRVLQGKVNIEISDLAGRGNDTMTLTGKGSMTITDGQLFEVPGLVKILSPFHGSKRFEAGKIIFDIKHRKFDMSSFGFESEGGGSVVGKGYLTFDGDYNVRVKVNPAPILGIRFFIFEIPGAIFGELFRTRLKGNLESADVVEEEVRPEEKPR